MFKRIRSKIGIKLLIAFSLALILSMVSLIYIGTHLTAEFGDFSASNNEENIKDNTYAFLARITHEQAMRYGETFQKIAAASSLIAKRASSIYASRNSLGEKPLAPSEELVVSPKNGIFSNGPSKKTMVLYWGSSTISPAISRQIRALSKLDLFLENSKNSNPESVACYFVSESAIARYYPNIHGVDEIPKGFDIRKAHWYMKSRPESNPERKAAWSNVYLDIVGHGLMTTASSPVYSETGQYLGAIGIDVTLDSIVNDILSDINSCHRIESMFSFLVDSTGKIISFPPEYLELFDLKIDTEKLVDSSVILEKSLLESSNAEVRKIGKKMIEEPYQISHFSLNGQPYIFSSHFMPSTGWRLGVVVPESVIFASVQETRNALDTTVETMNTRFIIVGLSFLLGTIIIMVLFTVKNIIRPINNLSKAALRVRGGDLTTQIDLHRDDEIGTLAYSFNNMVNTLRKGKELEKEYTWNLEKEVEKRTLELKDKNDELKNTLQLLTQEIAERKNAEEALRESEEKYHLLVENVPSVLWKTSEKGVTVFISSNIKEVYGYTHQEVYTDGSNSWFGRIHHNDLQKLKRSFQALFDTGKKFDVEYRIKRKDGEWIWAHDVANVVREEKGERYAYGVFTDITASKKAEKEQKKLQDQLQRAEKMEAIGTLAGGVAHDLNNILSGLVSYPEVLLLDIPEDSPLRKPILTIQQSGQKAASIVQDLLTLARRGIVATEVVNLNQVINSYLRSPEREKLQEFYPNATIETDLETYLLNIMGSPVHLSKSIMNLVSNAVEAMPDGGTVFISTKSKYVDKPIRGYDHVEEGDYVVLTVSDTGVGILPTDMERIFEPFYTKKAMGRSGTGLGMAVVWGTVKDHKGYIDVQSAEGKGTTFTLYFPVTRKEVSGKKEALPIEDYMGKGESILVVDDVEEQREIVSRILKKLGYLVTSVSSGEEAVDYLKDNSADLLILDMIMDPGIDGLDTYKKIIELHPGQKAIIASGFSETERVKEAQKLGAGKYIKKPYTLEKIGAAIKNELS